MHRRFTIWMILLLVVPIFLNPFPAAGKSPNDSDPLSAEMGIDYLIDFVKPRTGSDFDVSRLDGLIRLIEASRPPGKRIKLPPRLKATPAYYEFEVKKSLKEALQLVYHPDIPLQMVSPGSVRFSHWVEVDGAAKPLPRLWEKLDGLATPVVVKGVEVEEITPDLTTGAYYRSMLDRALILLPRNGHKLLVSLTRQKDSSEVGRKGLIFGQDDQWDYFFSGKKGLSKPGLGWVDSHIYDTFSVVVYYETDPQANRIKCCLFKWLRAGWLGANMVKEKHIQSGFKRFARDMKRVMESPRLPTPEYIAAISKRINQWSPDDLQAKMGQYLKQLEHRLSANGTSPHRWIAQAANDSGYVPSLRPSEMRAALFLETLKFNLGWLSKHDIAYLGLH